MQIDYLNGASESLSYFLVVDITTPTAPPPTGVDGVVRRRVVPGPPRLKRHDLPWESFSTRPVVDGVAAGFEQCHQFRGAAMDVAGDVEVAQEPSFAPGRSNDAARVDRPGARSARLR